MQNVNHLRTVRQHGGLARATGSARQETKLAAYALGRHLCALPKIVVAHLPAAGVLIALWAATFLPHPLSYLVTVLIDAAGIVLVFVRQKVRPAMAVSIGSLVFWDAGQPALAGSSVRVYQLAAPIVVAILIAEWPRLWAAARQTRPMLADRWLLALVLALVLYSLMTALSILWTISLMNTTVATMGQLALLALAVSYALLTVSHLIRPVQLLTGLTIVSGMGSMLALLQFVAALVGSRWGVVNGSSGVPWPRPYGLMSEPDWAALAAIICVFLSVWLRVLSQDAAWTVFAVAGGLVVLIIAARATWVAGVVALGVWVLVARRRWLSVRTVGAGLALLVILIAGFMAVRPELLQRLDPRILIGSANTADQGSANSRIGVLKLVVGEGLRYLPLGAGAGSLAKVTAEPGMAAKYLGGGELNAGRGSTNLFATTWFDLGPLGLTVVMVMITSLLVIGWRRRKRDDGLSLAILAILLVDFQFNNGIRFGFVWMFIGLLVAGELLNGGKTGPAVGTPPRSHAS